MGRLVPSGTLAMLCLLADPLSLRAQALDSGALRGSGGVRAEILSVAISINGLAIDGDYVVARRNGEFLVDPADLRRWRIRAASGDAILMDGERFVPLAALPGVTAEFDAARQLLSLSVPGGLFERQQSSAAGARAKPTRQRFTAFLNYDLAIQYSRHLTPSAFVEAGVSDDWGLIANTMIAGRGATSGGDVTRLDSYYLRDFPDRPARLVVGDTVTDAPDWTRQARFGGIRIGTEFSLQPDLVTFPTPELRGQTALPSSVELFVDNARRFQTQVGQGAFSIDQIPLVTGAGAVTLVTRDALGVERRVQSSYYVSQELLRAGLDAWSVEAGAERQGYGVRNFAYRDPFAAASYRRGINGWLTLGARSELSGRMQMAGAEANLVLSPVGEFGIAGAASQGDAGGGSLYRVSFRRLSPVWNVAFSYQRATNRFSELGIHDEAERITRQLQASAGVSLGRWGNAAMSYTELGYADRQRARVLSANYNVTFGRNLYASVFGIRSSSGDGSRETIVGASLVLSLGRRSSAYLQADSRNIVAEAHRTPPTEGGWGYRLSASRGSIDRLQAQLDWRGDPAEASLAVARYAGRTDARFLASGGLLLAGGDIAATRRVEQGVGIVEVPGQANVRVYQENRLITRTNARGRAIIPDLRAYEANRISIDPADLPLDVSMPQDMLLVVPRYRGGAAAIFATARHRSATVVLHRPDGQPVAPGASVITDQGEALFAGYDGEVFIEDIREGMTLEVTDAGRRCRTVLKGIDMSQLLARIGPLRCQPDGE